MSGIFALSWFEHRRIRGLCAGLGVELAVLSTGLKGVGRYALLAVRTFRLLARRRPHVLLVQNPSVILTVLAVAWRPIFGYRVVVDAHNEAIVPFIHRQRCVQRVSRWLLRRADLTIVTNPQLAHIVESKNGRAFVLPDRIPTPAVGTPRPLQGGFKVVLIATFAPDEPLASAFEAVRDARLTLYVTGDCRKLDPKIATTVPSNVIFTGFLDDNSYWDLLRAADAILDLTLMPDCLVGGAYEALALGKAMVLSGNAASVKTFGGAAIFTDNSTDDLRSALIRVSLERQRLEAAAARKRRELDDAWTCSSRQLLAEIATWESC